MLTRKWPKNARSEIGPFLVVQQENKFLLCFKPKTLSLRVFNKFENFKTYKLIIIN